MIIKKSLGSHRELFPLLLFCKCPYEQRIYFTRDTLKMRSAERCTQKCSCAQYWGLWSKLPSSNCHDLGDDFGRSFTTRQQTQRLEMMLNTRRWRSQNWQSRKDFKDFFLNVGRWKYRFSAFIFSIIEGWNKRSVNGPENFVAPTKLS